MIGLFVEQSDDFGGQVEQFTDICFRGSFFAELTPVRPVFASLVFAKHDIASRYGKRGRAALLGESNSANAIAEACRVPKIPNLTKPSSGNEIANIVTLLRPGESGDFLHASTMPFRQSADSSYEIQAANLRPNRRAFRTIFG
jgi:hypothetical protein